MAEPGAAEQCVGRPIVRAPRRGPPAAGGASTATWGPHGLTLRAAISVSALSVPIVFASYGGHAGAVGALLPLAGLDLIQSFGRMLAAYVLALGFALVYGYFAASRRMGERILIPLLDILQSIPILGFFPVAIVFFVQVTGPGSWVGPNLASVFLIFTCMAWNLVFGVYESLKSLPPDLREASESFSVHGWQRVRRVILPATINRLVYNSILSWTAGWYFLVAAEFISTSSQTTALHGIGSYLLTAAGTGDVDALLAGIIVLVALIALLDVFAWRPLGHWAEKYRYDQTPSGEGEIIGGPARTAPLRRAAGIVYRGVVSGVSRIGTPLIGLALSATPARLRASGPSVGRAGRTVILGAMLIIAWLLLIFLVVGTYHVFTGPIDPLVRDQFALLPAALASSFGRLVLAYLISLGICLPLALYLVGRPRAYRIGLPLVEIVASVPATALFPLFIFSMFRYIGFQGAAILMLTTGMLWYLFFNLLFGLRAIPPDLKEAATSFGLDRRQYYRRLVFPAILPALLTGSITAFGGGWNTLVIAEYLQYGPTRSFQVLGIGELIDVGNLETGGFPLMVAALFTMVIAVVAVNELLWKPLYRRLVDKYRYD